MFGSQVVFYSVFAAVFVVLLLLMRMKQGYTDRDLRHTPLHFGVMLVVRLFLAVEATRAPVENVTDRLLNLGLITGLLIYLIRLYLRFYQRLQQLALPNRTAASNFVRF